MLAVELMLRRPCGGVTHARERMKVARLLGIYRIVGIELDCL